MMLFQVKLDTGAYNDTYIAVYENYDKVDPVTVIRCFVQEAFETAFCDAEIAILKPSQPDLKFRCIEATVRVEGEEEPLVVYVWYQPLKLNTIIEL